MTNDRTREGALDSRDAAALALVAALRETLAAVVAADTPPAAVAELQAALARFNEQAAAAPRLARWGQQYHPFRGALNPIAPPLHVEAEGGVARGDVVLGAVYEAPKLGAQGGVVAGLFDSVLAPAARRAIGPAMTGELRISYRRPTPLYRELRFEAKVDRAEGRKAVVSATLHAGDDLCAEAEGLFIVPRGRVTAPAAAP